MAIPNFPFVGSEALASGLVKKHRLRAHFRAVYRDVAVYPDVYVPTNAVLTMHQRAKAAWLYSHREGVIAVPADSVSYALRCRCTTPAPRRRRKRGCGSC